MGLVAIEPVLTKRQFFKVSIADRANPSLLKKLTFAIISSVLVFYFRLNMPNAIEWTPEAEARLKEIPFFVRPAARKKIEKFAQDQGLTQITEALYEQAKQQFG